MGLHGEAVAEFAERFQKPIEFGDVIVAPEGFQFKHKHELYKHPLPPQPAPAAKSIAVSTLGALRDYLKANRDQLDLSKLMVHVETPNRVTVGSVLREPARDREIFITATAQDMTEGFVGKFHSPEDFNIGLLVRFVAPLTGYPDTINQRDAVIAMVSNIRTEQSRDAIDNGVTQTLEARAGVTLKSHQQLPNPVTLQPFRTFRDILQPSSPFVLRARAEAGSEPELCLFEADGGTWKLTAISRIHDWLKSELAGLPSEVAILA